MSASFQPTIEVICDREQCGWLGAIEVPNSVAGTVFAGIITTILHVGCLPLIILSPVTFPMIFLKLKSRFGYECRACRRGTLVPTDTERGKALAEREAQRSVRR